MTKLDATELTNAEVAVEAKEERDGIGTMTMEHPAGSNDLRHNPGHRGALDSGLDAPPSFEGALSEGDVVTEDRVEEEAAVEGGSGVRPGHVGVVEVLDVDVEVNADAGRRREGSTQAAMARRCPGHEGAGMLLIAFVRRHRNAAGLEVCGLAQPLTMRLRPGPITRGGRGANGPSRALISRSTGHRGCEGRRTGVQTWSGSHASGNQQD